MSLTQKVNPAITFFDPNVDKIKPTFHTLANLFDPITGPAFAEFVADIRKHGVLVPLTMFKGQIIDGRNRWLALEEIWTEPGGCAIKCPIVQYVGDESTEALRAFVMSENLHRRHLTESQRAVRAAGTMTTGHGGDRKSDQAGNLQLDSVSRTDAARNWKVSPESVTMAKKVIDKAVPEVVQAVKDGKLKVSTAAKIANHAPAVQRAAASRIAAGAKGAVVAKALAEPAEHAQAPAPDVISELEALLREIQRVRKLQKCERERTRWSPRNMDNAELVHVVDFIERELDRILTAHAAKRELRRIPPQTMTRIGPQTAFREKLGTKPS